MIKVTCFRVHNHKAGYQWKLNRKVKGQFTRHFNNMYELFNWYINAPTIELVKPAEELSKDQFEWFLYRERLYRYK